MQFTRRMVLGSLLASIACGKLSSGQCHPISAQINLPSDFVLEVSYNNKTIKITAADIMATLQPEAATTQGRWPSKSLPFIDFVPNGRLD
jgi:hypothetical protein